MKNWLKQNWFKILLLIFIFELSWFLVPNLLPEKKMVNIDKDVFSFQPVFLPASEINNIKLGSLRYAISEFLGTTLPVGWYDVCLKNQIRFFENERLVSYEELDEPFGELLTFVYPFEKNIFSYQLSDYLNFKNKPWKTDTNIVFMYRLSASPGKDKCLHLLTNEKGFLFKSFNVMVTEGSSVNVSDGTDDYFVSDGNVKRSVERGASELYIKSNFYALWAKRFVIFVLLAGLMLFLKNLINFLFGVKK